MADYYYLVCAPALELLEAAAAGSVYHLKCSLCLEHVCVAPSAQARMATQPEIRIICTRCAAKRIKPSDVLDVAPGVVEDALRYWSKG
jgi:hypothetical protein